MERTAESLDQVKLRDYNIAVKELRRYAKMMRAARDYLRERAGSAP